MERQAGMWERGPDGDLRRRPVRRGAAAGPASEEAGPATGIAPSPGPRALLRALGRAARDSYDHLGVIVLASFLWILLAVTLAAGGAQFAQWLAPGTGPRAVLATVAAAGVPMVLVLGPATAGLFRFARNACAALEADLLDLLWGFRTALRASVLLALIQFVTTAVLLADLLFFLSLGSMAGAAGAALFGYLLLFWGLTLLYQWPLLAELETGPRATLKKSVLLVLGNPGLSLATGAVALSGTILAWGIVLPALLLWAGVLAFVQTRVLRLLLQRYAILPPDPMPEPADESWGHGWHE